MKKLKEEDYKIAILSISSAIYDNDLPGDYDNALDILLHAAKKQIGQMVVRNEKYGSSRCPYCNAVVGRSQHYCGQCGQKLDWRTWL